MHASSAVEPRVVRRVAQHRPHPVPEQPASVARTAHEEPVGGHVRDRPQAVEFQPGVGDGPAHQGAAQRDNDVAHVEVPGDSKLREAVDDAGAQRDSPDVARRIPARHERRELLGTDAELAAECRIPTRAVEDRHRGHGGDGVEGSHPAEGVVDDGLRRPEPGGVVVAACQVAKESDPLLVAHGGQVGDGLAAGVAVQEARSERHAPVVDRGERRHHGGHAHRLRIACSAHVGPGCQRSGVPGARRVVLEQPWRRHAQLVGPPGARQDPSFGVNGDRFDRRGADIDPDCDGDAAARSHDPGAPRGSVTRLPRPAGQGRALRRCS